MKKLFVLYISFCITIICSASPLIGMGSGGFDFLGSLGGRSFTPRDFPFLTRDSQLDNLNNRKTKKKHRSSEDPAEKEDTDSDTSSTSSSRSSSNSEIATLAARAAEKQEDSAEATVQEDRATTESNFWQDLKRAWDIVLAFAGGDERELFEEESEAEQDPVNESSTSSSSSITYTPIQDELSIHLNQNEIYEIEEESALTNPAYTNAQVLHIIGGSDHIGEYEVYTLNKLFPNVRRLIFVNVTFYDRSLEALSLSFPHVEHLEISYNREMSQAFGDEQLSVFSQRQLAQQLRTLIIHSPNLRLVKEGVDGTKINFEDEKEADVEESSTSGTPISATIPGTTSLRSSSNFETSTLSERATEKLEDQDASDTEEVHQREDSTVHIEQARPESWLESVQRSWAIVLAFAGGDEREIWGDELEVEQETQEDPINESSTSSSPVTTRVTTTARITVSPNTQSTQFLANTIYPEITTLHLQDPGNIAAIHGPLSAETIRDYNEMFPNLERLIFENIDFSDEEALESLANSFPNARHLEIRDPGINTFSSIRVRTFNLIQLITLLRGTLAPQLETLIVCLPGRRITYSKSDIAREIGQLKILAEIDPEEWADEETQEPDKSSEPAHTESSTSTSSSSVNPAPAASAPDTALVVSNTSSRSIIGQINIQKLRNTRDVHRAWYAQSMDNKAKSNPSRGQNLSSARAVTIKTRQAQVQTGTTSFTSSLRMPRIMLNRLSVALPARREALQQVLPQAHGTNQGAEYTAIRLTRPDQLNQETGRHVLTGTSVLHLIGFDNYQVNSHMIEQLQRTFPHVRTVVFDNVLFDESGVEALANGFSRVENLAIRYNINLPHGIFGNQQLITLSQNPLGRQLRNVFLQSPQLHAMENTPEHFNNFVRGLESLYVNVPEIPVRELAQEELQELSQELARTPVDTNVDTTNATTTHPVIQDAESLSINQDDVREENFSEEAYATTELRIMGTNSPITRAQIELLYRVFPHVITLIFDNVEFNNDSITELSNSFNRTRALVISRIDDNLLSILSRGSLASQLSSLEIRSQQLTLRASDSMDTLNRFTALTRLSLIHCPLYTSGALNLKRSALINQLTILILQQVGILADTASNINLFDETADLNWSRASSGEILIFSRDNVKATAD